MSYKSTINASVTSISSTVGRVVSTAWQWISSKIATMFAGENAVTRFFGVIRSTVDSAWAAIQRMMDEKPILATALIPLSVLAVVAVAILVLPWLVGHAIAGITKIFGSTVGAVIRLPKHIIRG